MGERDGAEHYVERAATTEAYRCPDCGARPIDWDAVADAVWSVPDEKIWTIAPTHPGDPDDVFETVRTAADELDLELAVTFAGDGPQCVVCDAQYDVTLGE